MPYKTPRANWFKKHAEKCRASAKLDASKEAEFLRMASAYDALAENVQESKEIAELLLKRKRGAKSLKASLSNGGLRQQRRSTLPHSN